MLNAPNPTNGGLFVRSLADTEAFVLSEEDSEAAAHDRRGRTFPGDAKSWRPVVSVGRLASGRGDPRISGHQILSVQGASPIKEQIGEPVAIVLERARDLVANPEVDGEARV